ncbi:MAG: hypothetical protein IT458_14580 [Planctomycetes bacterium]|nr:hypothetical protein [Planctomycetota bacterium]
MSTDDPVLAAFQDALLEALAAPGDAAAARELLFRDPRSAVFREYVRAMEPRMLEVAQELVRRYGRREAGAGHTECEARKEPPPSAP